MGRGCTNYYVCDSRSNGRVGDAVGAVEGTAAREPMSARSQSAQIASQRKLRFFIARAGAWGNAPEVRHNLSIAPDAR